MTAPDQRSPEWDAASYHRVSDPHLEWGAMVLSRLPVRGDETALDLGCGTGRLTAELLQRLPTGQVIAVDRSRNMLTAAEEHLRPDFGDRVRFLEADLTTFDVDALGEQVELVFSTATFHWIPDHLALFQRVHGLLQPGGWLVAQCGGGPNLAALFDRSAELQTELKFAAFFEGWPGPWEFADDRQTAEQLESAGFVEIETGLVATPSQMADAEAYREFLTTVIFGTHLARLPNEEFRHDYIDALTDQAATDDPPFLLDYWRLNLRARRPPAP